MKKAFFPLILTLTTGLSLIFDHAPLYAQFSLSTPATVTAQPGAKVTIPLNLTNTAARPISAFGLVFIYPTHLLSFDTTLTTGTLTAGWIQVGGRENTSGRVTLGGFHTAPITASGVIINVVFKTKSAVTGCDTLKLRSFSDGLAEAASRDGVICGGEPSRVAEQPSAPPGKLALLANYPNPFNPATSIRYDLPKAVHVRLAIYNLLGEKIRTLIDTKETAGFKRLTWDATNDTGVRVASGVYLYRLEAGDVQITRKLLLMR